MTDAELELCLRRLRQRYGDLNVAHVVLYVRVHNVSRIASIAQDLGVNRSVVRRALQKVSDSDS